QEMVVRPSLSGQPDEVFDLVEEEQHRRPSRKADDDGMRDIAGQVSESQQGNAGLNQADHQGQEHGGSNDLLLALELQSTDRAEDRNRNGVGWSVDELL